MSLLAGLFIACQEMTVHFINHRFRIRIIHVFMKHYHRHSFQSLHENLFICSFEQNFVREQTDLLLCNILFFGVFIILFRISLVQMLLFLFQDSFILYIEHQNLMCSHFSSIANKQYENRSRIMDMFGIEC